MGLEVVVNIADFVVTNPTGADAKSFGDDHLRYIKTALKNDFAGFTGAVLVTGVDGGAADAYTLTPTHAVVAYTAKMLVEFTPVATNLTTTPTLNISGLGAKTIKSVADAALVAGDLVISTPTLLAYDGTSLRLLGPTKAYVDAVRDYATGLAFATALPSISAGVADYFTTNNGSVGSWSNLLKSTVIRWADGTDTTKRVSYSLSGITTGTTRAVTMPNKDGTMAMLSDLVLTVAFLSADQTITSGGSLTIAHSLGAIPKIVLGYLKCVTDEHGYTTGDVVCVALGENGQGTSQGAAVVPDATNLNVRYGSAGNAFGILNKSTGAGANITNSSWTFHLRAFT